MKKCISFITVLFLLVGVCACTPAPPAESILPTEPEVIAPDSLKQLSVDRLDGDAFGGIGAPIIYEDEDQVIFYTRYGLFAYDLVERKMIFTIDHVKAYGTTGSVQGETGTYAAATPDGMEIVLYYTAPHQVFDAYYIDVATMTWRKGEFQDLKEKFDRDQIKGKTDQGSTIREASYERNGEIWDVFAEYFN
ncbi:MAG: hypothetical protein E7451_04450 [Ruminococcaceae bacterium]|nr:hypothetical protein [Oscillospiraceae bacterium]